MALKKFAVRDDGKIFPYRLGYEGRKNIVRIVNGEADKDGKCTRIVDTILDKDHVIDPTTKLTIGAPSLEPQLKEPEVQGPPAPPADGGSMPVAEKTTPENYKEPEKEPEKELPKLPSKTKLNAMNKPLLIILAKRRKLEADESMTKKDIIKIIQASK